MRMMIVKNPNAYALIPHVLFVLQRVPLEHVESFACSLKRKFLGDRCSQFTNFQTNWFKQSLSSSTQLSSEWLCESGFKHVFELACSLRNLVTYKYLDVIENETSDQAGKRLAEALGVEYLPYTSNDWLYFSGKSDDLSKCTKEYLQDFGWMGQQKDYQEMCKLKKKNPLYYWDKKTLGVE
ncbi:Lysophosphatidylcholine_acyltransferase/Lyso-PAF acetyltransferase [Hexamita inflata]|uniref:Lysophosphatidylcholine acyltransferase/Lyso-PAF acetyltransferase n=1 Tax=Hexamita inflata TaxID=28002 RepID=A0AA86QAL5_9EUKA|nr:Lysophosphatidylcholine acyltransferase/Lyso-PAF acetyltransferase [Hexamita inflata]